MTKVALQILSLCSLLFSLLLLCGFFGQMVDPLADKISGEDTEKYYLLVMLVSGLFLLTLAWGLWKAKKWIIWLFGVFLFTGMVYIISGILVSMFTVKNTTDGLFFVFFLAIPLSIEVWFISLSQKGILK